MKRYLILFIVSFIAVVIKVFLSIASTEGIAEANNLNSPSSARITPIITAINHPYGLYVSSKGDLYIADAGSARPSLPWIEDGAVLVFKKDTNTIETILSGLPSLYFDNATLGIHDLFIDERNDELFLLMGVSFNILAAMNLDLTNFDPLKFYLAVYDIRGSSILKYRLSDRNSRLYDRVADFRDAELIYNPDHGALESNPFKIEFSKHDNNINNIFIADAAANAVWKVDDKRKITLFAGFDHLENPLAENQDPTHEMIDPVPTGIEIYKGDVYVSLFTGFPYLRGLGKVIKIDKHGNKTDFVTNLNWPIDIEFDEKGDLFILEYADYFDLSRGFDDAAFKKDSGRIIKVSKKDSSITTIVEGINFPTDIAFDKDKKEIFISAMEPNASLYEIGKGMVYRVEVDL